MNFEINGNKWKILEVPEEEFWKDRDEKQGYGDYIFGITIFSKKEIWLCKEVDEDIKRKTLIHELVHLYRGVYISYNELNNTNEEIWCDIFANSFDIINNILKDYEDIKKITKNKLK